MGLFDIFRSKPKTRHEQLMDMKKDIEANRAFFQIKMVREEDRPNPNSALIEEFKSKIAGFDAELKKINEELGLKTNTE